ncbi:MAG: hypothetical protein ACRDOO_15490 [Actinomadura sp.]
MDAGHDVEDGRGDGWTSSDHQPPPIGTRAHVHQALRAELPGADLDLDDPTWGLLSGPSWGIELGIGEVEPVESVMLHVRGGGDVLPVISQIASALDCRPYDCSTGDLLAEHDTSSWQVFQGFRDSAVSSPPDDGVTDPPRER